MPIGSRPTRYTSFASVVKRERVIACKVVEQRRAFFEIQRYDRLAVGLRLERVLSFEMLSDILLVVDFSVHGKNDVPVGAHERLLPGKRVDDCQTFMAEYRVVAGIHAAPVRSSVADFPRHLEHLTAQFFFHSLFKRN
jgi:hypothetical protein